MEHPAAALALHLDWAVRVQQPYDNQHSSVDSLHAITSCTDYMCGLFAPRAGLNAVLRHTGTRDKSGNRGVRVCYVYDGSGTSGHANGQQCSR